MFLVLALAACQAVALSVYAATSLSQKDVQGKTECSILTQKTSYRTNENILLRVQVINHSNVKAYVLEENWSGGIWLDRAKRRVVVAHYAFTRQRENELRGGWTSVEVYLPEFYELEPGQERFLQWSLGNKHERGTLRLEGSISVLREIAPFVGLEGTAAAEAIAKRDVVIPCVGKTIVIDGKPAEP